VVVLVVPMELFHLFPQLNLVVVVSVQLEVHQEIHGQVQLVDLVAVLQELRQARQEMFLL
jgi:hypothetical protein